MASKSDHQPSQPIRTFLSHFERTRILSLRAAALAHGAAPRLSKTQVLPTSAIEIARMELDQKLIPYVINRTLPDNRGTQLVDANTPTKLINQKRSNVV